MNVIPVINCETIECVSKKIEVAKTFLEPRSMMHLDVTDGVFAAHRAWGDPLAWAKLGAPFFLEVHLMVQYPEEYIEPWVEVGARRFIVHAEVFHPDSLHEIMTAAKNYKVELMLSLKPSGISEEFLPYLHSFAAFQVLAVNPGLSGQQFMPIALEKVRFLREHLPDAIIEVDGGINPETAYLVKEAGADTVVSSSYIFESENPKAAYEALQKV